MIGEASNKKSIFDDESDDIVIDVPNNKSKKGTNDKKVTFKEDVAKNPKIVKKPKIVKNNNYDNDIKKIDDDLENILKTIKRKRKPSKSDKTIIKDTKLNEKNADKANKIKSKRLPLYIDTDELRIQADESESKKKKYFKALDNTVLPLTKKIYAEKKKIEKRDIKIDDIIKKPIKERSVIAYKPAEKTEHIYKKDIPALYRNFRKEDDGLPKKLTNKAILKKFEEDDILELRNGRNIVNYIMNVEAIRIGLYVQFMCRISSDERDLEAFYVYDKQLGTQDTPLTMEHINSNINEYINDTIYNYLRRGRLLDIVDKYYLGSKNGQLIEPHLDGEYNNNVKNASLYCNIIGYNYTNPENRNDDFIYKNNRLREIDDNIDLSNLFGSNLIDMGEIKENCVRAHIKNIHHNNEHMKIIDHKDGVSLKELRDYSEAVNCKLLVYNINGEVICHNYVISETKYKPILAIAYNKHFYPISNKVLNKYRPVIDKVIMSDDNGFTSVMKLLKKKILPNNLKIKYGLEPSILSYEHNKVKYVFGSEYKKCYNILKIFGLCDYIEVNTNYCNIIKIIEKLYLGDNNLNSFIPQDNIVKGGYNYVSDIIQEGRYIKTIDKNKCYAYSLYNLPFLISCDVRVNIELKKEDIDINNLVDHYLYNIKVERQSVLLPDSNVYSGEFLKYCMSEGLKFEIVGGYECNKHCNVLGKMVYDLYNKLEADIFKKIIVRYIGGFEKPLNKAEFYEYTQIIEKDKFMKEEGGIIYEKDNYAFQFNLKSYIQTSNYKPIAIQIKDESRKILYEKMKCLNLHDDDIVKITTDSISYYCDEYDESKDNDKTCFAGWKTQETKEIEKQIYNECSDKYTTFIKNEIDNSKNKLYNCMAGTGKTHYILNKILPKIKNKSYIVLTPSNNSLTEYRKIIPGNCNVIQKYSLSNTLPTEEIIIIDEIGMFNINDHNILYKLFILGRKIIAFGDFNQLLPVGLDRPLNNEPYIKMIFGDIQSLEINYRNDFTQEYYKSIIDDKIDYRSEVKKYSTDNENDADVIICYRREQREKYNIQKHESRGYDKNDIIQKDTPLICITNKLGEEYDIYNNFYFIIDRVDNDGLNVHMKCGTIIPIKILMNNKYFSLGYAMTLYQVQGRSIKSYHYCKEDYYFLNPRTAYTTISRLKTKDI